MSERESKNLSRRHFLGLSVGAVVAAGIGGCSDSNPSSGTGGTPGTGGAGAGGGTGGGATGTGAGPGTGGLGAGAAAGTGGTGATASGGTGTGGAAGSGGTTGTTGGTTGTTGGTTGTTGGTTGTTGGTTGTTGGSGQSTGGADATAGADGSTGGADATAGAGGSTGGANGTGGGGSTELGLVTLVSATDWKTPVKDACVARMPDLTGKTVVVRPNVIEARPDGTTSPDVIAGVCAAAREKGASEVLICEDAFGAADCVATMQTLGITAAVGSDGTPTNLQGTDTTNAKPANAAAWPNGIDFYDIVKNADYVINVPKCKTHGIAGFSLALKAWLGSLSRPSLHGPGDPNIHSRCAEAHLVRQEDLVVLDATRCMTSGGPTAGGDMADSNVVAVSNDAIAADVTGVAILRANGASLNVPWQLPQITRAMALNFPGWLNAQADFGYSIAGTMTQADADAIMAKRSA